MNADLALHVTNGGAANDVLGRARIGGSYLSWDDCLHEGPIPGGLDLDALSRSRALYLAGQRFGAVPTITRRMQQRNDTLRDHAPDGEVYFWSTPELYDQLHLWQLLDWYATEGAHLPPAHIVWLDTYFSHLSDDALEAALEGAQAVDSETRSQGVAVWTAIRAADPTGLPALGDASDRLPFTGDAIRRFVQEFPEKATGLCRTERQLLEALRDGPEAPGTLFRSNQGAEEVAFMGDWSFWRVVDRLMDVAEPAVAIVGGSAFGYPPRVDPGSDRFREQRLRLTPFGEALCRGEADFIASNGVDRWQGGVHLKPGNDWRRDGNRLLKVG
ncbi:MAG: hypothetical protein AAGE01_05960 [Pseudomonadota bacterium]